jgi:hypothetical protein
LCGWKIISHRNSRNLYRSDRSGHNRNTRNRIDDRNRYLKPWPLPLKAFFAFKNETRTTTSTVFFF